MQRIHYAGGELITGNAIADAVVEYAEALATRRTAASIEIPVRGDDGSTVHAQLLIGPASQLVTEELEGEFDEIVDEELVARLSAETAALSSRRPVVETSDTGFADSGGTDDLEWPPVR
jgi:hypothetical protein